MVNWKEEVLARREDLLEDLKELLRIPSVLDESTIEEGAPFGHEVKRALDWMLATGERDGQRPWLTTLEAHPSDCRRG